uniref:RRM domain-containing protein n=1 Tax=Noctiluca scintillans TaxID=2966 RepID=A0A7S1F1R8_NOCSC|mmetsp:Transcript_27236/g.71728  ORF Transcript_27236/g.71728 Transcript_27236/m.71728 type:complete len:265 (+) Transcript_27236:53-847(+)
MIGKSAKAERMPEQHFLGEVVPLNAPTPISVGSISTLHVSGFNANANDREVENFCRFLPGFVAAKASVGKGPPKLWVRFDCVENALAARHAIDGQPFDLRDGGPLLAAQLAKTEMNPENRPRVGGASCATGRLDAILGIPSTPASGAGLWQPTLCSDPSGGKAVGGKGAGAPPSKRPRVSGDEEIDTMVIMKPGDEGLTPEALHEYFTQVEGYVALRMGGANCFVKFAAPEIALAAVALSAENGMQAQLAKSNMNPSQATHVNA